MGADDRLVQSLARLGGHDPQFLWIEHKVHGFPKLVRSGDDRTSREVRDERRIEESNQGIAAPQPAGMMAIDTRIESASAKLAEQAQVT